MKKNEVESHGYGGYQAGCRCDICKKDWGVRLNIYAKANRLAARWVKEHYRARYEECLDQAYAHYGVERPKNGGVRNSESSYWWNYNDL